MKMCPANAFRRQQGVALIMVLCALFMLSLVIFELARSVDQEMFFAGRDSKALDARALAFSGAQIALHPRATPRTPALRRNLDRNHRYEARITGEGGKLNLNWLLAGEDLRKIAMLKFYLANRGLNTQECDTFVDCMLDWVRPGDTTHLNGSRVADDGRPVPGRPFQDLAEVRRVVGSKPLTRQPGWEKDFTLLSKGPIDLQWASEDVIAGIPGVGPSVARAFVRQRQGPDKLDGTADDMDLATLQNPQIVPQLLGLSPQVFQTINDLLNVGGDSTVRVICAGQAFDTKRTVEVVARREGVQPQILSWKEY